MHAADPETFALPLLALPLLALAVLALATGCGSPDPKEVSKENFARVINDHILSGTRKGCMRYVEYPRTLRKDSGSRDRFDALVQVGMLASSDTTKFGGPAVRYRLTEEGRAQMQEREGRTGSTPALCYGTARVAEVTNYTEPSQVPGMGKATQVNYTYTVEDLAGWAREDAVQSAYGEIARWAAGDAEPEEDRTPLVLSGNGWVHASKFSR